MADLEQKVIELTKKVANMETKRVQPLEKVVKAMSRKVISLECQNEDMKKNNIPCDGAYDLGVSKTEEAKATEKKACNESLSSSFIYDKKVTSSTPKDKKKKKFLKVTKKKKC